MNYRKKYHLIFALPLAALASGCSAVYEDLAPCPTGVEMTAIFDNNLHNADAFASAAHCTEAHIYDENGYFVSSHYFEGAQTMTADLAPGKYHIIAYDGMSCEDASYTYGNLFHAGHHYSEVITELKSTRACTESSANLHPHFHSTAEVEVPEAGADTSHTPVELHMNKNTNNMRIILQHIDGSTISPDQFNFEILADNSTMAHDNSVMKQDQHVKYTPWVTGQVESGFISTEMGAEPAAITNAFAEISFGRIIAEDSPILHVSIKPTYEGGPERMAIDIPIVKYINMIKPYAFKDMTLQDYLDRQDQYSMTFVMDPVNELWIGVNIKVNDWIINRDDIDL